jgi:hypothetical protein
MCTGSLNDDNVFGGGETKEEEADEINNKILIFQDVFSMEYLRKYKLN